MLCTLHQIFFDDQIKTNEMDRTCCTNGGMEGCLHGGGEENRGKEPLGRPRSRRVNNIKVDV